ncbi:O-antigen ligase family protein [Nonomuraea sp. bgisy101]|uniref:O-antigen ligase family protein n=1 Tax=Nonomuraea sp. bgisy101 TaxID=3413784 RepID=UPI003D733633
MAPIGLILASEYKLRSRGIGEAIGGGVDTQILLEIGIYGLVALYLYRKFGIRPPRRVTSVLLVLAWVFALYVAMSVLWTPYPQFAAVRAAQLLVTASVCQVVASRATREDMHRLAHVFIGLVVVSVGIGVAMPLPRTPNTQDRFNWLYVHPVTAGIFLGIALLLAFAFLLPGGPPRLWRKSFYVVALVVTGGALVATGTRGAAAGCVVGLAVLLLCSRGPRGRAELLLFALPLGALAALAFSEEIIGFATRGESAEQLESLNSRTDLWTLALDATMKQPIFGNGASSARGLFLEQIGLGGGHNAFVNVIVEGGAVGLVAFSLLCFVTMTFQLSLTRIKEVRAEAALLLSLMAFLLVDAMTADMMAASANVASIWLFLIVAWTCVVSGKPVQRHKRHGDDQVPVATVS